MARRYHERECRGRIILEARRVAIDHNSTAATLMERADPSRAPLEWFRATERPMELAIRRCFARTCSTDTLQKIGVRQ
jgi:hypothetical protein